MGVGAAPSVGLDQPDRVVGPAARMSAVGRKGQLVSGCHGADTDGCVEPRVRRESPPPVGAGTSVSRVASGRQANRTGANGEVPMPAETCRRMWAPHCDG